MVKRGIRTGNEFSKANPFSLTCEFWISNHAVYVFKWIRIRLLISLPSFWSLFLKRWGVIGIWNSMWIDIERTCRHVRLSSKFSSSLLCFLNYKIFSFCPYSINLFCSVQNNDSLIQLEKCILKHRWWLYILICAASVYI